MGRPWVVRESAGSFASLRMTNGIPALAGPRRDYPCWLANMPFRYMQLLFPVLVTLHNAEEAIRIPRWKRRSGPWFGGAEPGVFRFVVVVFTALAAMATALSAVSGRMSFWGNVTFGYMAAVLFNAFFPHIAVSMAKRTLMPGVITAVALNVPILTFLIVSALRQGYVTAHDAVVYSIGVGLVLLLMLPLLFKVGKMMGYGEAVP